MNRINWASEISMTMVQASWNMNIHFRLGCGAFQINDWPQLTFSKETVILVSLFTILYALPNHKSNVSHELIWHQSFGKAWITLSFILSITSRIGCYYKTLIVVTRSNQSERLLATGYSWITGILRVNWPRQFQPAVYNSWKCVCS